MEVTAAGRTDAGVHAAMQVVHFDTQPPAPNAAGFGCDYELPAQVSVLGLAKFRTPSTLATAHSHGLYRYVILNARHGHDRGDRVCWVRDPLDASACARPQRILVGEHDFSSFRAAECQARTPMRNMHAIEVQRTGEHIVITVRANAFLHHMVRNIAGVLIAIGSGERSTDWSAEVLAARDRTKGGVTAPPGGLYLTGIRYTPSLGLPSEPADPTILP